MSGVIIGTTPWALWVGAVARARGDTRQAPNQTKTPAMPTNHRTKLDKFIHRFSGLVVMISVLHTEGPQFDPGRNHLFLPVTHIFIS